MGLFDSFFFLAPDTFLGPGFTPQDEFQSKSFYNGMIKFRIDEDGYVQHQRCYVKEEEDPNESLLGWSATIVSEEWIDWQLHGDGTIYCHKNGVFHNYRVRFTDGELQDIRPVPESPFTVEGAYPIIRQRIDTINKPE